LPSGEKLSKVAKKTHKSIPAISIIIIFEKEKKDFSIIPPTNINFQINTSLE